MISALYKFKKGEQGMAPLNEGRKPLGSTRSHQMEMMIAATGLMMMLGVSLAFQHNSYKKVIVEVKK